MSRMTLGEKVSLCSQAFIMWMEQEMKNKDMTIHDKDIENNFSSQVLLKKLKAVGVDIVLPDMLLLILDICVEGNPGRIQIVLKDLLNGIKKRIGPIPKGYIVTSWDFSTHFMTRFPIMDYPEMEKKYSELWDAQKIERKNSMMSDNLCDTVAWWKEVME